MSDDRRLVSDPLHAPVAAIPYVLSEAVARRWPGSHVLETEDPSFDFDTFLARVPCDVTLHASPHPLVGTSWRGPDRGLQAAVETGRRTIGWDGDDFELVELSWTDEKPRSRSWLVGPSRERVERFANEVARVAAQVLDDEVMVFANGCWQRSRDLRSAIRGATLDGLVLPPGMRDALVADFRQFLGAREDYERFGVAWKRGVLFLGPPGNGKTHCVKGLINALGLPCLYVQSFDSPYGVPQRNVHAVFERARRTTPCALVLEDLDALVTEETRSFFLNELDGFAANTGIVTIATTNHPERLDAAILDRPSRFDRKYLFALPGPDERLTWFEGWNRAALRHEVQLDEAVLPALAAATDGFSYAYLAELMVSSLVRWMSNGREEPVGAVAQAEVLALRAQMSTTEAELDRRHAYVDEHPHRRPR